MPKQKKQESTSILDSSGWINLASTIATAAVSVVVLVYTVNHGVTAKLDDMQRTLGDRITIMRSDIAELKHTAPEWIVRSIDRNTEGIKDNGKKIDGLHDDISGLKNPIAVKEIESKGKTRKASP